MEDYIYDVYICYSQKDYFDVQGNVIPGNEITRILQALDEAGISYWINKESIFLGDNLEETARSIESSRIFLFLSTQNSNHNSIWAPHEIAFACNLEKIIIPVRIDPTKYSKKIKFSIVDLRYIKYYENPSQGCVDIVRIIQQQLEIIKKKEEGERIQEEKHKRRKEFYRENERIREEVRIREEEYKRREEFFREEQKRRIQNELEIVKKKLEHLEERRTILEERQRQLEDKQYLPCAHSPGSSSPQKEDSNRSIHSGISAIVGGIGAIVGGIGGSAGFMAKKVKKLIDKTNVSFSALTNNIPTTGNVLSSVFAPAEVRRGSHMLVQVYLHLPEETNKVQTLAQEADKNAKRRDYIPLQCQLKNGDKVDVHMSIYGENLLMSDKKSVVWQGSFTKCSFDYLLPKDIDVEQLSCKAMLSVNGNPVGEMIFITKVVEKPRQLNPEIFSKQYQKIFISYAHQDEPKVEQMARAYKAQGVDYFFDRHYLQPGDVFPLKIQEFIDSADLFILCWSANAANSDYVELERKRALERAYPKIKPIEKAPLRIYPMSIEPRAELPADMRDTYNFDII